MVQPPIRRGDWWRVRARLRVDLLSSSDEREGHPVRAISGVPDIEASFCQDQGFGRVGGPSWRDVIGRVVMSEQAPLAVHEPAGPPIGGIVVI